ncbi:FAD binding domain-containing protein [Mesotoga prima]|uniref:FAD binding domain-containing protein n=1 Tax=Mesotoga prima TaxID=1184387 RepID=UPI002FE1151E
MLSNVNEYFRPKTVEEAYELMQNDRDHSIFLSGGTIVALMESSRIEKIIDLKSLRLDTISVTEGEIVVGATTTIESFRKDPVIRKEFDDFFYNAFSLVGSWQIRNMATIGGSVAPKLGWSDVSTCLLTTGSSLMIYGVDGYQRMLVSDYFALPTGEKPLITHVMLKRDGWVSAFEKFSKTTFDIATVNVGLSIIPERNRIKGARVVCGSRPQYPARFESVEVAMVDLEINDVMPAIVRSLVYESFSGGSNMTASFEYRKHLASVLAQRAAEKVKEMIT